jgi:hypothetical protein
MRVWIVGDTVAEVPAYAELVVIDGDTASIAARINSEIGVPDDPVPLRGASAEDAARALIDAVTSGRGLDPTTAATTTSDRLLASGPGTSGRVWLVDHDDVSVAMAAVAAAQSVDGLMVVIDGADLRANAEAGRVLRMSEGGADVVHTIGVTNEAAWQLPIILSGQELPGGGYLLFPGRRLVALYGNPVAEELGILGRQGLEESIVLARRMAEPYGADGVMVLPTFEIIATVAAAGPGSRGDYSNRTPADVIRPWIEAARREGFYVVLDLQPGRTHFLDQAMEYEEFLLEPHVGLALDPEWRLAPDQVHLRQIGQVDAAEVNEVSEWLASLVRENALPQKLFLLHQFRHSMLQDRERIQTPPELAVVIQMDGQGTIPNKRATWDTLTSGWEEHPWQWGWKNFTIEDVPGPIPPSEVLQLVPTPVFVSYQ